MAKENFPNKDTQFKKGESGNPSGRPLGSPNRSTIARRVLEMSGIMPDATFEALKAFCPTIEKHMSLEEIMTIAQAHKAIVDQDSYAYNSLLDSAYGKAKQETINVNTNLNTDVELSDEDISKLNQKFDDKF